MKMISEMTLPEVLIHYQDGPRQMQAGVANARLHSHAAVVVLNESQQNLDKFTY